MSLVPAARQCGWCRLELGATAQGSARFCSKRCRQTAFRLRRRGLLAATADHPLSLGYADPPYLGCCAMYGHFHPDGRCWNDAETHVALVSRLQRRHPDGWAMSLSARSLATLLPLCPSGARVCAWVKPHGAAPATAGLHNVWEPLIVVRGRQRPPGVRDALVALPARGGGSLVGRKPLAFCNWLFQCLGLAPGDEFVDWFPGSGVVGRAWIELSSLKVPRATLARALRCP